MRGALPKLTELVQSILKLKSVVLKSYAFTPVESYIPLWRGIPSRDTCTFLGCLRGHFAQTFEAQGQAMWEFPANE